jgi:hypothetical protein
MGDEVQSFIQSESRRNQMQAASHVINEWRRRCLGGKVESWTISRSRHRGEGRNNGRGYRGGYRGGRGRNNNRGGGGRRNYVWFAMELTFQMQLNVVTMNVVHYQYAKEANSDERKRQHR